MAELAGRLSERLCFERRVETRGPGGERTGAWETAWEGWGLVEAVDRLPPADALAETRAPARRWRVTLRAGPAIVLPMRLRWRGLVLRIGGVGIEPAAPGLTTLWVEEGEA